MVKHLKLVTENGNDTTLNLTAGAEVGGSNSREPEVDQPRIGDETFEWGKDSFTDEARDIFLHVRERITDISKQSWQFAVNELRSVGTYLESRLSGLNSEYFSGLLENFRGNIQGVLDKIPHSNEKVFSDFAEREKRQVTQEDAITILKSQEDMPGVTDKEIKAAMISQGLNLASDESIMISLEQLHNMRECIRSIRGIAFNGFDRILAELSRLLSDFRTAKYSPLAK